MTKTCEECHKTFVPGKNWDRQRFCCRNCKTRFARRARRGADLPATKECACCGVEMLRGEATAAAWSVRRFCSDKCRYTARNARNRVELPDLTPKVCERCGEVFTLPEGASAGARLNWHRRRYCGKTCGSRGRQARQKPRQVKRQPKAASFHLLTHDGPTFDPRDTTKRQGLQPLEAIPAHLKATSVKDAMRTALERHGDEFLHAFADVDRVARESPAKPYSTRSAARYLA